MSSVLRIGVLGAARIVGRALLAPAATNPSIEISAIATRNPLRGRKYAARRQIAKVYDSYAELVESPAIDAVYVPLPNSHHGLWTLHALAAGKHVLCEKPLAANAAEAEAMAQAASRAGRVLCEAFHYAYHPLALRTRQLVADGAIGTVTHVSISLCSPLLRPGNIRYRYDLAGGATMDLGCYAIHMIRYFTGMEATVNAAHAHRMSAQIDRTMEATFELENGASAQLLCSMFSRKLIHAIARIEGTKGDIVIHNPLLPHFLYHRLIWTQEGLRHVEKFERRSTYAYQLDAFQKQVIHGAPCPTDASDGVRTMRLVDDVYRAAGLHTRVGLAPLSGNPNRHSVE